MGRGVLWGLVILFLIGAEMAIVTDTFADNPHETVFVACIVNAFAAFVGAVIWEANR